jgi:hypothetical protein
MNQSPNPRYDAGFLLFFTICSGMSEIDKLTFFIHLKNDKLFTRIYVQSNLYYCE